MIPLATLSFTGIVGLAVIDRALDTDYSEAIYFLLVSFLAYFISSNLQAYKNRRWHDQAGDALSEAGSLGLVASIISIVVRSKAAPEFRIIVIWVACVAWCTDFFIRLVLNVRYLNLKNPGA